MTKKDMQLKIDNLESAAQKAHWKTQDLERNLKAANEHKADYEAIERLFPAGSIRNDIFASYGSEKEETTLLQRVQGVISRHKECVSETYRQLETASVLLRTLAGEKWGAEATVKVHFALTGLELTDGSEDPMGGARCTRSR